MSFIDYLKEKTLDTNRKKISFFKDPEDRACINVGYRLAQRFGLILNGWQEYTYMFTIPDNVPNEQNTFTAKNEKEIIEKLKLRFPEYLDYIMNFKFSNGYKLDYSIPEEPPVECDPLDLEALRKSMNKGE